MRTAVHAIGFPVPGLTDAPRSNKGPTQTDPTLALLERIANALEGDNVKFRTTMMIDRLPFLNLTANPPTGEQKKRISHKFNTIIASFSFGGIGLHLNENVQVQPDFIFGGADPCIVVHMETIEARQILVRNLNTGLIANGTLHFIMRERQ